MNKIATITVPIGYFSESAHLATVWAVKHFTKKGYMIQIVESGEIDLYWPEPKTGGKLTDVALHLCTLNNKCGLTDLDEPEDKFLIKCVYDTKERPDLLGGNNS